MIQSLSPVRRVRALARVLFAGLVAVSSFSAVRAALAADLHEEMGVGINYGQYFENKAQRTNKTLAPIPQAKFATIRAHGFKHVRLPVCWGWRIQPWPVTGVPIQIDDTFMANVKLSVDRALAEGLIVVLNTHHEDWFQRYFSMEGNASIRLNSAGTTYYAASASQGGRPALEIYKDIWRDIVANFDGDPKYENVIFEGLNEPRMATNSDIGDFDATEVNAVNQAVFNVLQDNLNQDKRRVYMMTVNDANNSKSFQYLTIPTRSGWGPATVRDQLIVTIHYYHNQDWTHAPSAAKSTWGTILDYDELLERLDEITPNDPEKFTPTRGDLVGVKVNIGEFGILHYYDNTASNRNPGDVLEWYRVVAAAAKKRGHTYTVWDDNGWFRMFNRNDGPGGSFDWGDTYVSEIWKMATLHENDWRLVSGAGVSWNLGTVAGDWSPWELKTASASDTYQRFQFQVDPGQKLGARDELRYPALRNIGGDGRFLDVENESAPGNGNAIRNRGGSLDAAFDHYVAPDYEGGGEFALAIPLPGPLYHGTSGTRRVIDLAAGAAAGTDAVLWQFRTDATKSRQRWVLEQVE